MRLRAHTAALIFEAKLALLRQTLTRKFAADQPRVPAGSPEGGQWTDGGGADSSSGAIASAVGEAISDALAPIVLVGGFDDRQMLMTVRQFVSQNCLGSINSVLPGQFDLFTIKELLAAAKTGDAAANRCYKLLNKDRFRK